MVVLSSCMFPLEGSSSSNDSGRSCHWPEALKCYVCDDFFNKPRILPCGHTFCSGCLSRLRQVALQEFNKSRDRNAHRRGDCGFFTCPWPNCHYSMKIMNLGRWSLKNKAASMAVAMVKKQQNDKQECPSQTDIDLSSTILTLPRVFTGVKSTQQQVDTNTRVLLVDQAVQSALSNDSLNRNYLRPTDEETRRSWRTYLAMIGMAVLEQVFR